MADPAQLEGLIGELRQSTSRLDQLKILTRAWRVLKQLNTRQRLDLAVHLGIEEGAPLLESLGTAGGLSPATLARAVAKAERAQPDELNAILRGLRTPGERLEAIRHGVDLVQATLREEDSETPSSAAEKAKTEGPAKPRPPRTLRPIPLAPDNAAQPPKASASAPPAPPPSAPPSPKVEGSERTAQPAKAVEVKQPEPSSPAKAPSPPQPASPAKSPSAAADSETLSTKAPAQSAPAASKPVPPTPDPRWAAVSKADLAKPPPVVMQAKVTEKSLLSRFRDWRRILEGDALTSERLGELLAEFPQGWPRRRALAAAIRAGACDDVDALLREIARLESPLDESWCLSALAHSGRLTPAQVQDALSRARAASSRRLLTRLLREAKRPVAGAD